MDTTDKAEEIAESLRREPYRLLTNDCIVKSFRFRKQCRRFDIPARMVICIGLARARWFGRWLTIPAIHAWGEVQGIRMETSRPLGSAGIWGIIPVYIKPVAAVWI